MGGGGSLSVATSPESLASGVGVSAGMYTGTVRVVLRIEDLSSLQDGEILVVMASNPVWTVGMLKSGAIITELGGPICHAAIIAREFGIPSVVAVDNITNILQTGMRVTVDGTHGLIFSAAETD
jgi:phosphoenolpyruvate synthase/pyruvate phosphate dikinase